MWVDFVDLGILNKNSIILTKIDFFFKSVIFIISSKLNFRLETALAGKHCMNSSE